jgi:hypothetical protein
LADRRGYASRRKDHDGYRERHHTYPAHSILRWSVKAKIVKSKAPPSLYFLVRTDGQLDATLAAIKDEPTGERFVCVFVSAQDAEEFTVANHLMFSGWEISEAQGPDSVHNYVALALRAGSYKAVANPPPVIHGIWRILPIKSLHEWSRTAKEPLLAWVGYEVLPKKAGK